jgi:hypothetical protein
MMVRHGTAPVSHLVCVGGSPHAPVLPNAPAPEVPVAYGLKGRADWPPAAVLAGGGAPQFRPAKSSIAGRVQRSLTGHESW